MSHCGESFGNMHKFKTVDMESIGKVRMYERYQDLDFDSKFEYKRPGKKDNLSQLSQAFLGGQFGAVSLLKDYYFFWKDVSTRLKPRLQRNHLSTTKNAHLEIFQNGMDDPY